MYLGLAVVLFKSRKFSFYAKNVCNQRFCNQVHENNFFGKNAKKWK